VSRSPDEQSTRATGHRLAQTPQSPLKPYVSVATVTLARDDGEQHLITATLRRLSEMQFNVAVSDGGSPGALVESLRALRGVVVIPPVHPGLVGQVKAAVNGAGAFEAPFVLYLEADKASFVNGRLEAFVRHAPQADDIGVVLASRTEESFRTYPVIQQRTESTFNGLAADVMRLSTDYLYGPFLLNRRLLPYVERASPELGWGWRPFIFAVAHRLGFRIAHVDDEHPCPTEQRIEDEGERIHRLRQLSQNINGLVAALVTPLP
jgi:hypothetical protein